MDERDALIKEILAERLKNPVAEEIAFAFYQMLPSACSFTEIVKDLESSVEKKNAANLVMNKRMVVEVTEPHYGPKVKHYAFNLEDCMNHLYQNEFTTYVRQHIGENAFIVVNHLLKFALYGSMQDIAQKSALSPDKIQAEFSKLSKLHFIAPAEDVKESEEGKSPAHKKPRKSSSDTLSDASIQDVNLLYEQHKEDVYKVNTKQLLHDIRAMHIFEFMTNKVGLQAATLIFAMLKHFEYNEEKGLLTSSQCIALNDPLFMSSTEEVKQILEELSKDNQFLTKEKSGHYMVNVGYCVEQVQEDRIVELVKLKYGSEYERVYKVAATKGSFTEEELVGWTLLPIKRTQEIMQELSKEGVFAKDMDGKLKVNYAGTKEKFVRLMYRTAGTLIEKKRAMGKDEPEIKEIDKALKELSAHLMVLTKF